MPLTSLSVLENLWVLGPFPGDETPLGKALSLQSHECQVCGYVYDPVEGSPEGDVGPGTSFEEMPGYWCCPVCRGPRGQFKRP
jgi:rubredoxin